MPAPASQPRAHPDSDDAELDLEAFFDLSLDCLTVAGFDGYLKRINPAWTRVLGWTMEELHARPSLEFVHPEDREATLAARAGLQEGRPLHGLVNRYLCKDGGYRWFEWRSVSNVERGRVYAVARDITAEREAEEERRRMEAQLVRAERMASIGRLAAGVAHEINNPLAYVMANVGMVLADLNAAGRATGLAPEHADLLADALEGAERVRRTVLGLMSYARASEAPRTRVDVRSALEVSLGLLRADAARGARLVEEYGPVPQVLADPARLEELFHHLLDNAVLALTREDDAVKEVRVVTSTDEAGQAVVEIHDTGTGIPPGVRERIFEPFFTTRPAGRGTGLGLAICQSVVTSMGGSLTVRSEEGRGSTFRVVLPPANPR